MDPNGVITSLCSALDVEFEHSLLEVGQINSSHQSSVGGARKGLHKDAIDTWKSTLSGGETAIAERQCRQLMKHYGYTPLQKKNHSRREELPYIFSYIMHALGEQIVNPRLAWIQFQAMPASLRMQKLGRNTPSENRTGSDSPAGKEQE